MRRHGGVRLRTDSSKINRKEGQDDNIVECQVSDLESILDVACPISSRKRRLGSTCPGRLDEFVRVARVQPDPFYSALSLLGNGPWSTTPEFREDC